MKVVVTGGAGFIGSALCRELLKEGYEVKIIDNLFSGNLKNLDEIKNDVEIINGDVHDLSLLQKEFKDVDCVFHQAAVASVPRSVEDPLTCNNVNITGTLNVFIASRDNNVKRVVYASSSAVYGDQPGEYKIETMPPVPISPYAVTKLVGEQYAKLFYDLYGLETFSLRYFNVFGPRQDPNSDYSAVIPKFVKLMLDNKRPKIFGDGLQSRDFSFVKNNVNANLLAMKAKKGFGEVFNIACGERTDVNELVNYLNEFLCTTVEPEYLDERAGDIKHSLADISKATEVLGYKTEISFKDGLRKTIDWYKENSSYW